MICPKCRQPGDAHAQYCGGCGQRLESAPRARPEARLVPAWSAPGNAAMAATAEPMGGGGAHQRTDGNGSGSNRAEGGSGPSAQAPGFVERLKSILLSPRTEWPVVEPESTSIGQLFTGYVIPLTLVAVVASFVRMSVLGVSLPFGGAIRTPMTTGLTYAVMTFAMGLVGVFVVGLIINALAPTFGGARDQRQALKTAAYSLTPAWIGSLFALLPSLGTLLQFIAGIYGIYLLYLGLPVLMRSKRERAGGYTATVVLCTILCGIVLGVVSAALGVGRASAFGAMSGQSDREVAREQGAAAVASVIGGALGTDDKGKAGIASALSNLAKAGEQMEAQKRAENSGGGSAASQSSSGDANALPDASGSSGSSAANGATASGSPNQADAATNAMGAAGGLLSALGGALGGGRHVEPVDFHTLEGWLPNSAGGMSRTNVEGGAQQAIGVKGTSATAKYRGDGDARMEIKVSDASGVAGLMGLADSLGASQSSEDDNGYDRQVVVAGRSVHEKYDRRAKHAELEALVAKRFSVELSGDDVDMKALEQSLGSLDLATLESMKDAGAKKE
jgi:hypothetical protein